jgi:LuxR family maltose regulon positive regulatory protein
LRSPSLDRHALVSRLYAGMQHKLTLISAGAGFGKTTLAAQWTRSLSGREGGPAAAWVSLDEGDNDPRRFWRYLFSALQMVEPEAGSEALRRLEASQEPDLEEALTALINILALRPSRVILVLED